MNRLRIYFSSSFLKQSCYFTTSTRCAKKVYGPMEIGRCTLNNGIKLVSAKPFGAQMGACTILYQGGSRYEVDDQLGVTHFLRTCSGASGCAYSTFRLLMKHSIVASACGTGSSAHGQHHEDHVSHPPLSLLSKDVHTQFKAFNLSYCDTGVFGIVARCPNYNAGAAACAAASFMRKLGDLTTEQLCVGIKRLSNKMAVAVVGDVQAVPHDQEIMCSC